MKKLLIIAMASVAIVGCHKQQAQPSTGQTPASGTAASPAEPAKVSTSAKTYDGPFGLAGALPIAELKRLGFTEAKSTSDVYVGVPPKPLDGAKSYAVLATAKAGACRISTHTVVTTVNGSGDQLKAEADRLADMMQIKYGKQSSLVNYAKEDVYRRNPEFWMMGLKEESVTYAYEWSAGKTATPLPGDLSNIEIAAATTRTDSGFVTIQYTFKNFKDCIKEMDTNKASSL